MAPVDDYAPSLEVCRARRCRPRRPAPRRQRLLCSRSHRDELAHQLRPRIRSDARQPFQCRSGHRHSHRPRHAVVLVHEKEACFGQVSRRISYREALPRR